ncbi:ester cyclase [Streptomyces sp. NPDC058583]|uniref:ester cyclase n=1 Tax=unclassified Streptomyces TaxID=2593676 RepID=UPI003655B5A6
MTTAPEKNTALLRTAYQAVESGDFDAAEHLLTENFIANVPGLPEPLVGRDVWRLGTRTMKDAYPDLKINRREGSSGHAGRPSRSAELRAAPPV